MQAFIPWVVTIWFALIALKLFGFLKSVSWFVVLLFPIIAIVLRILYQIISFLFYAALGFFGTWTIAQLIIWAYSLP